MLRGTLARLARTVVVGSLTVASWPTTSAVGPVVPRAPAGPVDGPSGVPSGRPHLRHLDSPIVFEPNRGQASSDADFVTRGRGYALQIWPTRTSTLITGGELPQAVIEMRLAGASDRPPIEGRALQSGRSHYLRGADRAGNVADVPHFGRVVARNVYPGIDMVHRGSGRRLEYDFVIAPGADPDRIAMRFSGQSDLRLADDGALVLRVSGREVRHEPPVVYQLPDRDVVDGAFAIDADGTVRFELGPWDRSRTLVIDPVLVFGSYLGGSGSDRANAVAVDATGNIYVTGTTSSTDFPTAGAYQGTNAGPTDAFVTKFNAAGTAVVYSTYLGSSHTAETGVAIAVDSAGSAYVAGAAGTTYPTTSSPLNSCLGSPAFVTKLTPAGNALSYSICFSGGGTERINGIAVDGSMNAYLTGTNGSDATLRRLNATGTAWVYNLTLSGSSNDEGYGVAADSEGNACVTGRTSSTNFPVVNALQPANHALIWTAFAAKYTPGGTPVFVTYLGGSVSETGHGAAIDASGNCYVAGYTNSTNFPIANAAQATLRGGSDAFVTAYNPSGSAYLYSTYLGGTQTDVAYDIDVTPTGMASLVGETASFDFPAVAPLQAEIRDLGAVHVSTMAGAGFSRSGLTGVSVQALAIDPTNAQVMYAGTAVGIYKSTNGGTNWTRVDSGLAHTNITSLAIDPNAPCTIYGGAESFSSTTDTNAVLVRSTTCGASWGYVTTTVLGRTVSSVALTNANPATLYWSVHANQQGGVHGIGRLSASLPQQTSYLPGHYFFIVALDPANPCTAYGGERFGRVVRNTSCSSWNWAQVGSALDDHVKALAPHPTNQATLLAGTITGRIYRKADDQSPWAVVTTVTGGVNAIAYQPGSAQVVYAATSHGVLLKSTDGGSTWSPGATIGPRLSSLGVSPAVPALVAVGTSTDFDTFYTQVGPTGTITASSWVGGYGPDRGFGVALTPGGDAVIVGQAALNWPATSDAPYTAAQGGGDAYVARIDPFASPPNTPPTISDVPDQTIAQGGSTGPLPVTVGDAETPAASLTMTGATSDATLVPLAGIVFGGSDAARTVTVTPAAGQSGAANITLTVSDGGLSTSDTFVLTVSAGPDPVQPPVLLHVASVVGHVVSFRWTPPVSGPAPTGYVLEGGIAPGQVLASLPTGSAAPVFTLSVPTGSFHVRVHALDGAARSGPSNEVRIHVGVGVAPSAPESLLGLANGPALALAWRNTYGGGAATSVVLDVTGAITASLPLGVVESFAFAGVPPGTYTFSVRAQNGGGSSPPSTPITLTFPGACGGPPSVPTGLLVYRTARTVFVEWGLPGAGPAPTGYVMQVTGSFVGSFPVAGRSLSGTAGPGSYTITVLATNACGAGPPTAAQTIVVP